MFMTDSRRPSTSTLDTNSEHLLDTPPSSEDALTQLISIQTGEELFTLSQVPELELFDYTFDQSQQNSDSEEQPAVAGPSRLRKPRPPPISRNVSSSVEEPSTPEGDPWITVDAEGGLLPTTDLADQDSESAVYDFFIEDDGKSLLADLEGEKFPRPVTEVLTRAETSLSVRTTKRSRFSRGIRGLSTVSHNTIESFGSVVLSLSQLCDAIERHRSLQRAEIVATESYALWMGAFLHRFIVLELHRQGRKPVYLRLDRRLGKGASTFSLIRSSGSTPANDVAQFASFKKDLMTGARLENKQLFENVPTLGELRHFLLVICDEIKTYQVWPANCWFFCSLLQQHLAGEHEGRFKEGGIQYPELARDIRERVKQRLRLLYHVPMALSITTLLESFRDPTYAIPEDKLNAALELSRKWDLVENNPSPRSRRVAAALIHQLLPVLAHFHISKQYLPERLLWSQHVKLCRLLLDADPTATRLGGELAHSLFNYGVCLHEYHTPSEPPGSRIQESCAAQVEALGIRRVLSTYDERQKWDLGVSLHNYGISLSAAGRVLEACNIEEEAVALRRGFYDAEPSSMKYRTALAQSTYNYGLSLAEADAAGLLDCIDEACKVLEQSLWLRRQGRSSMAASTTTARTSSATLNDVRYGDRWGLELAAGLNAHGWALHCAGRYKEACTVKAEAVAAYRASPAHRRTDLASAVHNLGTSLYEVGRLQEAHDCFGEAVRIRRRDCEVEPALYQADYEVSLHDFNVCRKEMEAMERKAGILDSDSGVEISL